ncbi:uncharacterized protein LOC135088869 [Scylla paramamosain]|uniref:uncharacterized protein LOC135088869 n=1 Tax=Scylla paramamosain TaxID=85552 RepID=UPI003083DCDB
MIPTHSFLPLRLLHLLLLLRLRQILLLALLKLSSSPAAAEEVRVFSFQRGIWGAPSDQVFARYNFSRDAPPVTQLSVCYRLRFESFSRGFDVHVSYKARDDNGDPFYFGNNGNYFDTWFDNKEQSGLPPWEPYPEVWRHVCHTFDTSTYTLYWEGQAVFRGPLAGKWPCPLNGTLVLGQEQDNLGGGFDKHQIFRGDMTQVSLWDRVVSPFQVSAMAACREPGRGNLFSSDTFPLEEVGVQASQHSLATLCQHTQHHVVFPEERTLREARSLCRRLNASLAVPASADDNRLLADQLPAFQDACVPTAAWKLWLGITDRAEDGVWRKFHNNEQISYRNFPPVNAASSYYCASMKQDGFWDGDRCANRRCAACHVERSSFLYLRGLCFDTKFRMRFRAQGYINGRPFFRGYYDKVILWQEQHKQWALVDAVTNATMLATQDVADNDYPLGRHPWEARRGLCSRPKGTVMPLSLSSCEDHEFTCSTGDCVPRGLRCDFRYDCGDGSDEESCGVVQLKDHLQRELPPPGVDGGPLTVTTSITLSRIADVDDIAMAVTLEFRVSLAWTDSRLRLRHLRLNKNGTILTEADAQNVWQPRYSLVNLEGGTQQRLGHSLVVTSSSGAALPSYNSVDMDLVYPGAANNISLRQRYTARVTCYFELYAYPFDIQLCSIDLELPSELDDYVRLAVLEGEARYTGPHELSKYTVEEVHFSESSGGACGESGV